MSSYKWCVVPLCTNTTLKTPTKLFICVPMNMNTRRKWLQLARRNPDNISPKSVIFFCEDHFDMEKDMKNYCQYKMGFSKQILLNDGVMPTKFNCQQDRRKITCDAETPRPAFAKRQRKTLIEQCENEMIQPSQPLASASGYDLLTENVENTTIEPPHVMCDKSVMTESITTTDKSIQCHKLHYRSKAVQTKIFTRDTPASPYKFSTTSSSTSPFKIHQCSCQVRPSRSGVRKRITFAEERSDSDVSSLAEASKQDTSSYTVTTSSNQAQESGSSITDMKEDTLQMQSLQHNLRFIMEKPKLYIGIPKESYFIVHLIHKHTKIPHEHILLCLKKIRLNSTFLELEDNFGLTLSYASKIFLKNIPLLASVLRPFIVKLDKHSIAKTLPVPFRHNYYKVNCIIDCLEIDVQKPSKALFQALTWSDYKKGNTVKYLISCTPNGLVNYISPGFGGRASDVTIIENCNFLDCLEPGTLILADRGFKHVEQILNEKGIKLLRPPSVASGAKLSKAEVRQTKIIASLRIHIERVIRRLREFHMLKQHSVINKNYLRILDDVIIIACALINIQDSLIK